MISQFEWDQDKATTNIKKHRVSFEEDTTVFSNPLARIFYDETHSTDEEREIIIGHSTNHRLLLVWFTERTKAIRIFSARRATKKEKRDYEEKVYP